MPKINQEEYEVLKELDDEWKWIARDKDRGLYTFTEKPVRKYGPSPYWWDVETEEPCSALELIDEIHLFQFIQWEDEEPHKIAELIEEYEYSADHVSHVVNERVKALGNAWRESEETEVKKDLEWFKKELDDIEENTLALHRHDAIWMLDRVHELYGQLDEPEVLSQEWIDEHVDYADVRGGTQAFIHVDDLQNLLVPTLSEMETVEITEEQVMEWLDNNDFYDHTTAETVLANAVDKGELGYYGTKYSVVEKEPETVADVVTTFWKSYERLKEVMSMEVEELE